MLSLPTLGRPAPRPRCLPKGHVDSRDRLTEMDVSLAQGLGRDDPLKSGQGYGKMESEELGDAGWFTWRAQKKPPGRQPKDFFGHLSEESHL